MILFTEAMTLIREFIGICLIGVALSLTSQKIEVNQSLEHWATVIMIAALGGAMLFT